VHATPQGPAAVASNQAEVATRHREEWRGLVAGHTRRSLGVLSGIRASLPLKTARTRQRQHGVGIAATSQSFLHVTNAEGEKGPVLCSLIHLCAKFTL